jgi:chaperonin GroEL
MAKQIDYNTDARKKLKKGVDYLAKAVVITLRPRGAQCGVRKAG